MTSLTNRITTQFKRNLIERDRTFISHHPFTVYIIITVSTWMERNECFFVGWMLAGDFILARWLIRNFFWIFFFLIFHRNARRQMRFGDQKVVLIQGHYLSFLPLCSRNEPVFLATCTPIAMPETRECVVQGATNVFTTIHSMDMKFVHIDKK